MCRKIWKLKRDQLPRDNRGRKESSPHLGCPPTLLLHGHLSHLGIHSHQQWVKGDQTWCPQPSSMQGTLLVLSSNYFLGIFIIYQVTTTHCGSEWDRKPSFHPSPEFGVQQLRDQLPWLLMAQRNLAAVLCSAYTKGFGKEWPAPAAHSQGLLTRLLLWRFNSPTSYFVEGQDPSTKHFKEHFCPV